MIRIVWKKLIKIELFNLEFDLLRPFSNLSNREKSESFFKIIFSNQNIILKENDELVLFSMLKKFIYSTQKLLSINWTRKTCNNFSKKDKDYLVKYIICIKDILY